MEPDIAPDNAPLWSALRDARRELTGVIYKGGSNQAQRYKYVGHEQVLMVVRGVLLKHDLVFLPTHVKYVAAVEKTGEAGKVTTVLLWEGLFELTHVPSGMTKAFSCMASTILNDKAAFVASTSLERVALLRLMALAGSSDEDTQPFVEDPESDHAEQEAPSKPANVSSIDRTTAAIQAVNACEDQATMVAWFRKVDAGKWSDIEQQKMNTAFMARLKALNLNWQAIVKEARGK
jgi:hypothetical protein